MSTYKAEPLPLKNLCPLNTTRYIEWPWLHANARQLGWCFASSLGAPCDPAQASSNFSYRVTPLILTAFTRQQPVESKINYSRQLPLESSPCATMAPIVQQPSQLLRCIFLLTFTFVTIASILYLIFAPNTSPQLAIPFLDDRPVYDDMAYEEDPIFRLSLNDLGGTNQVYCWPSVGGILVARRVTPVELDFLSLPRFTPVLRRELDGNNATAEDAFCRRLRLLGAHWYVDYWDYLGAHEMLFRPSTSEEDELLHLGWPENGEGVWVLRQKDKNDIWEGMWRMQNAFTMDERCKALEMAGATFFERPEDSEHVKTLLEGFGENLSRGNYQHL